MISQEKKTKIVPELKAGKTDTGSPAVQFVILPSAFVN